MIQTILFATDMGPHTHYLLHHVNALAEHHRARVVVIHAIEPPGCFGDAVVQSFIDNEAQNELLHVNMELIVRGVRARLVDMLEEEFIDGQQGLSLIRDVRVLPGRPAEAILDQAGRCEADLIILGSHGAATEQPNVLGSVTSRVLALARVPVYMVPLVRNLGFSALAS